MMNIQQATHAYVSAFVDELARCGVRNAVICPGSRSTPLALLLAAHAEIKERIHLDERSAAFFARGFAKAHRKPLLLRFTSVPAAAHFLPSRVYSHYSHTPLPLSPPD